VSDGLNVALAAGAWIGEGASPLNRFEHPTAGHRFVHPAAGERLAVDGSPELPAASRR